ncbi:2OG-Fe(II) oxygenase [Psychrosphaera haliotis]|uniref:2OG-Fe(II) oxygenase n=1 Tax=Psychrosphaera haliotis TaxID=555083 RepID=A0A6N8FD91_9GAMM|nr:2OG-Fe(II) oxygenase [Psychrosphaera haliotis]MUH72692.1 2OG-Fe(II) oxygenase [Psychrosphaera haliotis]
MSKSQLQRAQELARPSREEMLVRAPSVQYFWDNNRALFEGAWAEWEQTNQEQLSKLGEAIIAPKLREAVAAAWQDPSKESAVYDLWEEVSPGVYQCQFFDPEGLVALREYLEKVADAQIPLRPPYGIVLNRHGAMLDPRSEGYLAAPGFQRFYREIMDQYMRPIARLLFPEVTGFDTQTFGFSIQYQAGVDTSLRLHTDASAATLNINMNKPGEEFTGSEVDFYDPMTGNVNRLTFEPGMAMLHKGNIAHAAQPITSGERSNMVLWLYGDRGRIPQHSQLHSAFETSSESGLGAAAKQRWTLPESNYDGHAPF